MVYLSTGWVDVDETRRVLEVNTSRGGMKRLMEEAVVRHTETVHYSTSIEIRVGGERSVDSEFWLLVLEGLSRERRGGPRGEAGLGGHRAEQPSRRETNFMEAACQNYEVLVEDKQASSSKQYKIRSGPKKNGMRSGESEVVGFLVELGDRKSN